MKRIFTLLIILTAANAFASFSFQDLTKKYHQAKKKKSNIQKGGAMDGGGTGGQREEEGAAWFYQDKLPGYISVCINKSQKFKASESDIKDVITNSFNTWENYINNHNLYKPDENDDGTITPYPENLKILTKIKFENCSSSTEITFYFGVEDSRVREAKEGLHKPKGFAFRKYDDIDAVKGTSKGIVWIFDPSDTPTDLSDDVYYDWSIKERLQAIVNHEVGHIMGIGHYAGTIMEADLETLFHIANMDENIQTDQRVKEMIIQARKNLVKIDHSTTLIQDFNFENGKFYGKMGLAGSKDLEESFKFFMNRKPKGEVKIQLLTKTDQFYFIINDDIGSKQIEISNFEPQIMNLGIQYPVNKFKRVRKSYDPNWGDYDFEQKNEYDATAILRGNFQVKGMGLIPGSLEINNGFSSYFEKGKNETCTLATSPLTMHYFDVKNLKRRILFVQAIDNYCIEDDDATSDDIIIGNFKKK